MPSHPAKAGSGHVYVDQKSNFFPQSFQLRQAFNFECRGAMSLSPRFRIPAALVLTGLAAPLLAAPADQVPTRLRELGRAFRAVNDGLWSAQPQPMLIHTSARQIGNASQAMYSWFPAGSGPQPGVKTAAKPEIWTQVAQFRQKQDAFAAQAAAFESAAGSNDVTRRPRCHT
jgi:cytochrome c556